MNILFILFTLQSVEMFDAQQYLTNRSKGETITILGADELDTNEV